MFSDIIVRIYSHYTSSNWWKKSSSSSFNYSSDLHPATQNWDGQRHPLPPPAHSWKKTTFSCIRCIAISNRVMDTRARRYCTHSLLWPVPSRRSRSSSGTSPRVCRPADCRLLGAPGRRRGLVGQIRAYVLPLREPMRAVTAGRSGGVLSRATLRCAQRRRRGWGWWWWCDVGERSPEQHPRCLRASTAQASFSEDPPAHDFCRFRLPTRKIRKIIRVNNSQKLRCKSTVFWLLQL